MGKLVIHTDDKKLLWTGTVSREIDTLVCQLHKNFIVKTISFQGAMEFHIIQFGLATFKFDAEKEK